MKSYFHSIVYTSFAVIIAMLVYLVYRIYNIPDNPCAKAAYFPSLMVSKDTARKWLTSSTNSSKPYSMFVFNAFDSCATGPWQLICYGQHDTFDTIDYHPLSDPLPIYDTLLNCCFNSTNMAFGNMELDPGSLKKLIDSLPGNSLKFVPETSAVHFKHLTYRVYEGHFSPTLKKYIGFDKLRGVVDSTKVKVKVDSQNNEYIQLNPAPPAKQPT